ncbi:MAG: ethanolamine ammonia-lyase subunit EutC [Nibricoccus sp.]
MNEGATVSFTNAASQHVSPVATSASTGAADPWSHLRKHTSARIALGRSGGSQLTNSVLDFRLSHARARDAVQAIFEADQVEQLLRSREMFTFRLNTSASDRRTYLIRPDQGRQLDDASKQLLFASASKWGSRDLAIIVSDGLAAQAAKRHAVDVVIPLVKTLAAAQWSIYPIFVVPFARVKLQDEVGEILGARHTLMLLGERPGLGSPDSLGAYFTFKPHAGCTDADRNCVSNIRPDGLAPAQAAVKVAQLLCESARLGLSGVALKDTGFLSSPLLSATRL